MTHIGFPSISRAKRSGPIKARLAELGSAPLVVTPEAFGRFLVAETEKWAKAVKFSGAQVD